MPWDPVPSTFDRARRRDTYRRLAKLLGSDSAKEAEELPSLEDFRKRLSIFEQHYVGIRAIEVAKIVGTADRAPEFDREFHPKNFESRQRWQEQEKLSRRGAAPPIAVYQVGDLYYVIDGHHRVSVAKETGQEFIDAEITELFSRIEIPPDADIGRLILMEQEALFMDESGIDRARPEATIQFSRPMGYVELLEIIRAHGYKLMRSRNQILSDEEVAGDFYDGEYLPGIQAIKEAGLFKSLPGATEADLFLWVWQHRRSLFPEHGSMSLPDAARKVGETRRPTSRLRARMRDRKH